MATLEEVYGIVTGIKVTVGGVKEDLGGVKKDIGHIKEDWAKFKERCDNRGLLVGDIQKTLFDDEHGLKDRIIKLESERKHDSKRVAFVRDVAKKVVAWGIMAIVLWLLYLWKGSQ